MCVITTLGVAYDSHRNIFYWAIDGGATRLRQLTGGDTVSSELSLVANPSSVALDYIGQRLYWIEEIRENGVSLVCVCQSEVHVQATAISYKS